MDTRSPFREADVPLLRGVLHAVSCPVTVLCGAALAALAPTARESLGLFVMSLGFAAIFGTSGLYHRIRWTPRMRRHMRCIDHAMIFVGMAMTYTALWLVVLDGVLSDIVLAYVWVAAMLGIIAKLLWIDAHPTRHWLGYVSFGLVGLVVLPSLWAPMGPTGVGLLVLGAMAFAVGGAAFAFGRPNPIPRWFGHHEVFHLGTIVGCVAFLAALAQVTLR